MTNKNLEFSTKSLLKYFYGLALEKLIVVVVSVPGALPRFEYELTSIVFVVMSDLVHDKMFSFPTIVPIAM